MQALLLRMRSSSGGGSGRGAVDAKRRCHATNPSQHPDAAQIDDQVSAPQAATATASAPPSPAMSHDESAALLLQQQQQQQKTTPSRAGKLSSAATANAPTRITATPPNRTGLLGCFPAAAARRQPATDTLATAPATSTASKPAAPKQTLSWMRRGGKKHAEAASPTAAVAAAAKAGTAASRRSTLLTQRRNPHALHAAAWGGDLVEVQRLVATGAAVDKSDQVRA